MGRLPSGCRGRDAAPECECGFGGVVEDIDIHFLGRVTFLGGN